MAKGGDKDEEHAAREGQLDVLPGEEEYENAVRRHAKYLGIDPENDAAYMWIAEEVCL